MLNQVILIGRLVKKPELRESEDGENYIKRRWPYNRNVKIKMVNTIQTF